MLGFVLTLSIPSRASATENNPRFYVGLFFPDASMNRAFDGAHHLQSTNENETIVIPEIDNQFESGIILGYRLTETYSLEFNYTSSIHNAAWNGTYYKVIYIMSAIDNKWLLFNPNQTDSKLYVLGGINFPKLIIKNGAFNNYEQRDAVLNGIGYDLGLGFTYNFTNHFAINGELIHQITGYNSAKGIHVSGGMDPVDISCVNTKIIIIYSF
jgi:hypothetical protein